MLLGAAFLRREAPVHRAGDEGPTCHDVQVPRHAGEAREQQHDRRGASGTQRRPRRGGRDREEDPDGDGRGRRSVRGRDEEHRQAGDDGPERLVARVHGVEGRDAERRRLEAEPHDDARERAERHEGGPEPGPGRARAEERQEAQRAERRAVPREQMARVVGAMAEEQQVRGRDDAERAAHEEGSTPASARREPAASGPSCVIGRAGSLRGRRQLEVVERRDRVERRREARPPGRERRPRRRGSCRRRG